MRLTAEEAYRRFADNAFAAAFSICRDKTDADDAVHDTFIKYISKNMDYNDEEHIKAWLLRTAINRAKDFTRSFARKNSVPWEDYMDELEFAEPEDSELFEAVMKLPDKYRIVIHLFYYEEQSITEISKTLKRREGTVKSQLSRGRALLKEMLTEEWNND